MGSVGWNFGVGQKRSMGKCFAIHSYSDNAMSSIEHYIIAPTEFIKLYSILNWFRVFNPNETCVRCIFKFIFKFVLPRLFLKLRLSLVLNMKNNQKKNYERAESEDIMKKNKNIFDSKKEFLRVHSLITFAKSLKFESPTSLFPSMHKHLILI